MMVHHKEIEKKELNPGVWFQYLGKGAHMNVFHWNMVDGSEVAIHSHTSEQFGYVIRGGFRIVLEGESFEIHAGDAYFIPPDKQHSFIALDDTEAIDVFHPYRNPLPDGRDV